MPMISLSQYLMLAAVLFTIGAIGVVVLRNALTVLMSIELMLNAANLSFVAFSRFPLSRVAQYPVPPDAHGAVQNALSGQAAAFFVIATAAAEAAVGLAILIAVFRKRQTTHVDEMTLIRDADYQHESSAPVPAPAAAHAESH